MPSQPANKDLMLRQCLSAMRVVGFGSKANIPYKRYANAKRHAFPSPNLWRNVKVPGHSIAFAFAFTLISAWNDHTCRIRNQTYGSTTVHYMLFHFLSYTAYCILHTANQVYGILNLYVFITKYNFPIQEGLAILSFSAELRHLAK